MSRLVFSLLLLASTAGPALAQEPGPPQGTQLRERIEHRFAEHIRQELNLTDEQAARLKQVAKENGARRRDLRLRERALTGALDGQLSAGANADQDSLVRLTRDLLDLRVKYEESYRDEMKKLSFLTPMQRARLMVMRDRLIHRVHEMRGDRRGFRDHGHDR
jgi:hypothetical protein